MSTITVGRTSEHHAPNMQNIPRPERSLEEKVLRALADDNVKTFGQLALLCGTLDPSCVMDTEGFDNALDEGLRRMIATGQVILVARRPELCFRKGTVLDQIVKGLERDA